MRDELKLKISLLPTSPGVYQYLNRDGVVIYVGKAKNLKRRVSSYFNRVHPAVRTNLLVRNIWDMKYIVVNSEEEALDLEANLIKEFQPRYNVLLKDDKSYPWICVTKEMFPRVFLTREKHTKGVKYYGPYPKAEVAHTLIEIIKQLYPIRTCRHVLTTENVEARKYKLCLQYHIKNCEGCCQGFVSRETYSDYIDNIVKILNGDTKQVSDYIMQEMMRCASELKFEEAELLKRKYQLLEQYRAKSVIVNPTIHNVDVFTITRDEDAAFVNFMHVRNGAIVQSITAEYKFQDAGTDETNEEVLSTAVRDMRQRYSDIYKHDIVKEILVNVMPDFVEEGTQCLVPQRGDKKRLVAISLKNAEQYRTDRLKRLEKLNPEQRATRTLTTMMKDLHLPQLPRHIECFDNSSTGGTNAVASCVVFKNGKPSKKDYRHFNIKEASGNDDYAQMREVINRRYSRLLSEGGELPQLLLVDGGKGQLSAAVEVLDTLGLRDTIVAIGIAKRLDEIFFPGDSVPLYIDKSSETLRVLQRLRDEAHRFGITHHRNKRSKSQVRSQLDDIRGIGPKTRTALLKHFKSVKRIKEATPSELANIVGASKAQIILETLNK